MQMINIDDRRTLVIPGDATTTVAYAAQHWSDCCHEAVRTHGEFFVALSGGSTPKAIFEQLTKPPYREQIPWDKIHFFWSDERNVPPNNPESNYHMAMEAGLKNMPIPAFHIHRMLAEIDIERGAENYEATIRKILPTRIFDFIMLGMGEDGHTASLFPHTQALSVKDRWIVANHIPQKNTWRMTMTYPCINSARHIAIYVIGASKNSMLTQVLRGPDNPLEWPSQKVGTPSHRALWIADSAAAEQLL